MAYLDQSGLDALWEKVKNWTNSVHAHSMTKGASSQDGLQLMLKNGAQSPATLSTVTITKGDITALGIPGSDTKYAVATQSDNGLMSAADKKKLDGVEANANHYVHPNSPAGAKAFGLYKVATNEQGHVTLATAVIKSDISPLESDPTVPAWAKAATKPSYRSTEIDLGESMNLWDDADTVEDAIGHLFNDKQDNIADLGTIRSGAAKGATAIQTETDPTVPAWAKAASKPSYLAHEIGVKVVPSGFTEADNVNTVLFGLAKNKAPKDSPAFTGTPTAPTAAVGTDTTQIATTAFVQSAVAAASIGVAKYQGGMSQAAYELLDAYKQGSYEQGWYWVIIEAGTYAGEACEVGDMMFCKIPSGHGSDIEDCFDIVQNNIEAIPLSVINALS